eukprot:gnl/Spiro4/950_TR498_c0_g2_i1.p1 gnl/Spiro4/950_TR498_c0_g2~~gnl/Spiro4/950_TR498_c0_g2_i1.p1  ORF type:complete len:187 (+),score=43.29 gnl/Spiro4/950_TR498_c0_g2_i1:43-561(+)
MLSRCARAFLPSVRGTVRSVGVRTGGELKDDKFGAAGKIGGAAAEAPAAAVTVFGNNGRKATLAQIPGTAYSTDTTHGVSLAPFLTKTQGSTFGMYHGVISPGGRIGREIHASNTETIYVLEGEGIGFVGHPPQEFAMRSGDVMHVEKNVYHGLANTGTRDMKVIVIGNPDY